MTTPFEQVTAARFTQLLGIPVHPLTGLAPGLSYEGWRVKTVDDVHAEIWCMLFTWRLALVPAENYYQAGVPFWCFERNTLGLMTAMANAAKYDGREDWEPIGHTRAWRP